MDQKAASCLQSEKDICSEALEKMGNDARTYLMGLPMNLLWISVCQELKQCFSNFATSAHATVSHNTIMQKPSKSLCTYVPHYNTLYCAVTDKIGHKNMDPTRNYHLVTSMNNTMIPDKVAKQV